MKNQKPWQLQISKTKTYRSFLTNAHKEYQRLFLSIQSRDIPEDNATFSFVFESEFPKRWALDSSIIPDGDNFKLKLYANGLPYDSKPNWNFLESNSRNEFAWHLMFVLAYQNATPEEKQNLRKLLYCFVFRIRDRIPAAPELLRLIERTTVNKGIGTTTPNQ